MVLTDRDCPAVIHAEGCTADDAVAFQHDQFSSRGHIPDPCGAVFACGYEQLAVRAESRTMDGASMTVQDSL